jgi:dCTP deaminase
MPGCAYDIPAGGSPAAPTDDESLRPRATHRVVPNPESLAAPAAPGLLPFQDLSTLIADGIILSSTAIEDDQIQPASIDLRLSDVGYRVQASFLPGEATVETRLADLQMHAPLDLSRPCLLERGCVYIIPLQEELRLPPGVSAKANPKSTTGRLDVFTRLITDRATEFDRVPQAYHGRLYVEVVPRTFSIVVAAGTKLNQLRVFQGRPGLADDELRALHESSPLVFRGDTASEAIIADGLWLTIDLQGSGSGPVGYRAKPHGLIDLSRLRHYDPAEFWEPVHRSRRGSIILNPDDFYILASREQIRVPPDLAAEMVAYEPPIGEFRVHYAGFFDPGFGYGEGISGTRGVLEVRSHEVPFLLEDGQIVARLVYERLLSRPTRLYGTGIGSSYQHQGLTLSKQFRSH